MRKKWKKWEKWKSKKTHGKGVYENEHYFTWIYIMNIVCKKNTPTQKHTTSHVKKKTKKRKKTSLLRSAWEKKVKKAYIHRTKTQK